MRLPSRREWLLSALPTLLSAQEGATFSTDVKVVNLLVSVRNKKGEFVRNLKKEDFVLDEDGRFQNISYFTQESALGLTLGIMIDTSASQRFILGKEREASSRFLEQVMREDKDKAFLVYFARGAGLLQEVTSSRDKLKTSLGRLERPGMLTLPEGVKPRRTDVLGGPPPRGAGTALYDAVQSSSEKILNKLDGRKALIILTDGIDTGSKVTMEQAIEAAQRANTLIYSILFADPNGYPSAKGARPKAESRRLEHGNKTLQRLSKETGGGFFQVSKKLPIEKVFDHIQEELRHQYSLGYTPAAGGTEGFRKIRLTTKASGLNIQTRTGYYATN